MIGHSVAVPEPEAESEAKKAVEERLGVSVGDVNVHRGPRSQELAADLNARAFTVGSDIHLGDSHGRSERHVIAHEMVHVAQQRATGPRVQRSGLDGSHGPEEAEADAVAEDVAEVFLVDDSPGPSQRGVRDFLGEIERRVTEVASRELGPTWTATGCPYIAGFFAKHRTSDAATVERLARRYSGIKEPASAEDYMEPIVKRVGEAVRKWRTGDDVGDDLGVLGMGPLDATVRDAATRAAEVVQRKAEPGHEETPVEEVANGAHMVADAGRPLPAGVQRRMSSAFSTDFSAVRVHDDSAAGKRASSLQARAYTLGTDVTFGSGQFQPGTLVGDALLAHELAHVVQQSGGALAAPGHGGEEGQADLAAANALMNVDARATHGLEQGATPTALPASRGLRLQRCGESTPDELSDSPRHGAWEGKTIGYHVGNGKHHRLAAVATVGFAKTEDAAIALALSGRPGGGAVTLEEGEYVAYQAILPNHLQPGDGITVLPGVVAITGPAGYPLRPVGSGDGERPVAVEQLHVEEDPLRGFREAFGSEDGKLGGVRSDDDLLRVFDAALKQVALSTMARSKQEVERRQQHLAGGTSTVSPSEIAHIRATIAALVPIATSMEQKQSSISSKNWSLFFLGMGESDNSDAMMEVRAEIAQLESEINGLRAQRAAQTAKYPLLARYDSSSVLKELGKRPDDELLSDLGGQTPAILNSIAETAINISKDEIDLWEIQGLVEQTIAELRITDADQRQKILHHQKERAKRKTITNIVTAVFTIGLAIGGAIASGGLSLVLSAGAFGLGFYDAVTTTQQYLVQKHAANTGEDPADSLLSPEEAMHWGWLVVAWAGVLFDAGDVASAAGKLAKSAKVAKGVRQVAHGTDIGQVSDELVREVGLTGDKAAEASSRLRRAAGELEAGTKISFATMAVAERRLGTTIQIAADLPPDAVRVMYKIDDLGNVSVLGARVGTEAKVADIIAHAGIVKLLRRYDGVLGRLRQVWDKLQALVGAGGIGSLKRGSASWESFLEMSKYERVLAARKARLGQGGLSAADEVALKADVDFFEEELRHHESVVRQMSDEAGAGFIASSGNSTRNALDNGYRLPSPGTADGMPGITKKMAEANPALVADSKYYYRLADKPQHQVVGSGPVGQEYVLVRRANYEGPSFRGLPGGGFEAGELTRAQRAAKLMAAWPQEAQRAAFATLEEAVEKTGGRLVPLAGISRRPGTMADILKGAPPGFDETFKRLLRESYEIGGKSASDAKTLADQALDRFREANVTIVQGTKDLRSFGYRARYAKAPGQTITAETDLHHIIPLYLGGNHSITNLAQLPESQHQQMHRLLESIKLDDTTTLAPSSVQAMKGAQHGVAIITDKGAITFLTLDEMVKRAAAPQ